jgi:hypothetical protein
VLVLVLTISSIYSVYAQNDVKNTIIQKDLMDKVLDLDNELNPAVTATLTGLSLTGASFLMSLARTTSDSESNKIHIIKKYFIKAFFMFLVCTIVLFIFDFIEIMETHLVFYVILDVIITFSFFGLGVIYLARAAKQLYSTYGK